MSRRRDGVFKKNGWWWIDYEDADGKRHRQKAAPSYEAAKLVYRAKMTAIARGEITGVREEGIRVRDFIAQKYWPTVRPTLSTWEQHRAEGTIANQIVPAFGDFKLASLRRETIERWQAERLTKVASGTVNKELVRLKHLLNRAVAWGYIRDSPTRAIRKTTEAPGRVRYLTPDERRLLLDGRHETVKASDGRTWTIEVGPDADLKVYIVAALATGARRGELMSLRWRDVDMKTRTVTFQLTKNGDARTIPMTETLRALLLTRPRPLDADAPVFPQRSPQALTRAFGYLVRRLGIKNLRFHDLRHDAASTLTMAGVSQRAIMAMLGHRDPRMSVRYQHLAPEHLHEAARALDTRPHERANGTISAPAG
jgi:integrase